MNHRSDVMNYGETNGKSPNPRNIHVVYSLENLSLAFDEEGAGLFAFIITYAGDTEHHVFSCLNPSQAQNCGYSGPETSKV